MCVDKLFIVFFHDMLLFVRVTSFFDLSQEKNYF